MQDRKKIAAEPKALSRHEHPFQIFGSLLLRALPFGLPTFFSGGASVTPRARGSGGVSSVCRSLGLGRLVVERFRVGARFPSFLRKVPHLSTSIGFIIAFFRPYCGVSTVMALRPRGN